MPHVPAEIAGRQTGPNFAHPSEATLRLISRSMSLRSVFAKWLGTGAGAQMDRVRTKAAIAHNTATGALDAQLDVDTTRMLEMLRKEPPRALAIYVAHLVDGAGVRRVVAAEIDYFGLGRPVVEKMMAHMQKALLPGERLESQELKHAWGIGAVPSFELVGIASDIRPASK